MRRQCDVRSIRGYEEPIVIEPEKNMSSQAIVRMPEYKLVSTESSSHNDPYPYSPLAKRTCFRNPNVGSPTAASVTNFT